MSEAETSNQARTKRIKVSQTDFPNSTLQQAMRIAQPIWDDFAGKGAARHQIAMRYESDQRHLEKPLWVVHRLRAD
jgi:hypothetical protein